MRKKTLIALATALVLLVVTPLLLAGPRPSPGGADSMGTHFFERAHMLKRHLGLSDEQARQIRDIVLDVRDANAASRKQLKANVREAAEVLLDDPANLATAEAILARNDEAKAQMKSTALQGISDALSVLTPEQREKLGELLQKRFGDAV